MAIFAMSNNGNLVKGVVTSTVAFALFLLLAEIVIRLLGLAPDLFLVQEGRFRLSRNPRLGYELMPGFEADSDGPMYDYKGKANSMGFRDDEHAVAKPQGCFRILVLGDSITQGFFIRDPDDIFTAVLADDLMAAGVPAEVLNFGVNGYNTAQEVDVVTAKIVKAVAELREMSPLYEAHTKAAAK